MGYCNHFTSLVVIHKETDPAIVLSMFMFSFIFVIVSGSEYVQAFFYCLHHVRDSIIRVEGLCRHHTTL